VVGEADPTGDVLARGHLGSVERRVVAHHRRCHLPLSRWRDVAAALPKRVALRVGAHMGRQARWAQLGVLQQVPRLACGRSELVGVHPRWECGYVFE
jgi:hypothetical protein